MNKSIALVLLFGFTTLVSSACDFSTALCSSAGFACPSGGTIQIGNNTYGLSSVDVVSFNEATITNGDIQGRTAVRNNFYGVNGVSVADTVSDGLGYGLIVGGNLIWPETGAIYPFDTRFFIGGSASVPSYLTSRIDSCTSDSDCLRSEFDSVYSYWNQFSSSVNAISDNIAFSLNNGYGVLTCSASAQNYFIHVAGSQFSQATSFCVIGCNMNANFVITIVGDVTFQGRELEVSGSLIFNVVNAGTVTVSTSIAGHIVAVNSNIVMTAGTIYGSVIAGNLSNVIQINQVTCDSPVIPSNQPADPFCASLTGALPSTSAAIPDATTGIEAPLTTGVEASVPVPVAQTTGVEAEEEDPAPVPVPVPVAQTTGAAVEEQSTSTSGSDTGSNIGGSNTPIPADSNLTAGASSVAASLALFLVALLF